MTKARTKKESPFLNRLRDIIRTKQYSIRTEKSYVDWVRRFILFHNKRHPEELGEAEVGEFLTYLAVKRQVSPSTQNQALNALVFLYRYMLNRPLADILGAVRAKRHRRLPVVLARDEVRSLFHHLDGPHWLPGCLLYGSGLRLMECLRLRVKDREFAQSGHYQTRQWPHTTPLLCYASAGARHGYTHGTGTAKTQGYSYHADLYSCAESRRECRGQSVG